MNRRLVLVVACLFTLAVLAVAAFLAWTATTGPRRAPEVIRGELLALTPVGTSQADVEASLRDHGRHEGVCWTEGRDGLKSEIVARYGLYRTPTTLLFPTTVQAHYHFDPDGRLTDVTLRRYPEPYPGQGP